MAGVEESGMVVLVGGVSGSEMFAGGIAAIINLRRNYQVETDCCGR